VQTRRRLIEAAATEFAERGYAGATLQAVVREAGVTMGGLTFHFPSKSALADAVQEAGDAATAQVVAARPAASDLCDVLAELLQLAETVQTTPSMRATARFAREGREGGTELPDWYASWVPRLRAELERIWQTQQPESGLTPAAAAALLSCLVIGVEASAASRQSLSSASGCDPREALEQLTKTLGVLLCGPRSPN
jgi:AcrR family transcriptional regulator